MIAFYSEHPDNLKAPRDYQKEYEEWIEKVKNFGRKYFLKPILVQMWRSCRSWSIPYVEGKQEYCPVGFRLQAGKGKSWHEPDLRTKIGKQAKADKESIPAPLCWTCRLKGMPGEVHYGDRVYWPAGHVKDNGKVWIAFGCTREQFYSAREFDSDSVQVDLEIWTEAKLSEYYAAVERIEAEIEAVKANA